MWASSQKKPVFRVSDSVCLKLAYPKLQILTRVLKLYMEQVQDYTIQKLNNKGTDLTQPAMWMRRLVCAFVVCMQQSQATWHQGLYDYYDV